MDGREGAVWHLGHDQRLVVGQYLMPGLGTGLEEAVDASRAWQRWYTDDRRQQCIDVPTRIVHHGQVDGARIGQSFVPDLDPQLGRKLLKAREACRDR